MQACLDAGEVCIRCFNNSGSLEKLEQAYLDAAKVCIRRFNHRGKLQFFFVFFFYNNFAIMQGYINSNS